jgi:hypothetical protein
MTYTNLDTSRPMTDADLADYYNSIQNVETNDMGWAMNVPTESIITNTIIPNIEDTLMRRLPLNMSLHQLAPVVAINIAKEFGIDMSAKVCLTACAIIRTMYSVEGWASWGTWNKAGEESAKYFNFKNNDQSIAKITKPASYFATVAHRLGYIEEEEGEGCFITTDKWDEMIAANVSVGASVTPISKKKNERLREDMMKSRTNPSTLLRKCVYILEATSYCVDHQALSNMVDVVEAMHVKAANIVQAQFPLLKPAQHQFKAKVKAELVELGCPVDIDFVVRGCELVKNEKELYSEYDADARGRLYHVMCFGPNPQSSDMARSVYALNGVGVVKKDTASYDMFMNEMKDISSARLMEEDIIRRVAANPVKGIVQMLGMHDDDAKKPKSPFTYARMCQDWVTFQDTGECVVTIGFGLDAKCSGTQYLAIVAGCPVMQRLTGLTIETAKQVGTDPYIESAKFLNRMLNTDVVTRKFIKTAYMAVQYGGGENAVTGEAEKLLAMTGIRLTVKKMAKAIISAIKTALGSKINRLIEAIATGADELCRATNKEYFTYKMTDGLVVKKPGYLDLEISESSYKIRVDEAEQVIFGKFDKDTGLSTEWKKEDGGDMDLGEFARNFMVNHIQGLDALVARTFVKKASEAGLHGITSIHDCFRCCLADAPKMMKVVADTYYDVFIKNDQLQHLKKVFTVDVLNENTQEMVSVCYLNYNAENVLTQEVLYAENAYYFCQ